MSLSPEKLLDMYRQMVTIRKFDDRAAEECHKATIPGGGAQLRGPGSGGCGSMRRPAQG